MYQTYSKFNKRFIVFRSEFLMAFDFQNTNTQSRIINSFDSYFV